MLLDFATRLACNLLQLQMLLFFLLTCSFSRWGFRWFLSLHQSCGILLPRWSSDEIFAWLHVHWISAGLVWWWIIRMGSCQCCQCQHYNHYCTFHALLVYHNAADLMMMLVINHNLQALLVHSKMCSFNCSRLLKSLIWVIPTINEARCIRKKNGKDH